MMNRTKKEERRNRPLIQITLKVYWIPYHKKFFTTRVTIIYPVIPDRRKELELVDSLPCVVNDVTSFVVDVDVSESGSEAGI